MEKAGLRSMTTELAEDLAWLEGHCRQHPDAGGNAGMLRLAAGVVRNVIGPYLEEQPAEPLHIAIVGGAGAGKSTLANMLCGAVLAESNPQAGFTRHPIAYTSNNGQITWTAHVGFLGPLQRLTEPTPSNLDADVYQVRRVPSGAAYSLLNHFIVWDCPDMTTWAATGYASRLLEIAGLADVVIYVASDERYNDLIPTEYLRLFLGAGKAVVVCLVKMDEKHAAAFLEHFQQEVLAKMPAEPVACLTIPHLTGEELADPINKANRYRVPLLNQISVLGDNPRDRRARTVRSAMNFLTGGEKELLGVARADLTALQTWRGLVHNGQIEFDGRYRREYLTSDRLHRFDEALVKLLDLLELPGVGKYVSSALWVLRTPYRMLRSVVSKAMTRPEARALPERPILEAAFTGWIDMLRREAAQRTSTHPLWTHINQGFYGGLTEQAREHFDLGLRGFQASMADEVDRTARAIYEEIEKNPVALNTLRGTKFALDAGSIAAALAMGGIGLSDLILVPLAASVTHQLVELLGKQYVDTQREHARNRQQTLVTQYVSAPLAEWLVKWPSTGGSTYERLHQALTRIPSAIRQLQTEVKSRMEGNRG